MEGARTIYRHSRTSCNVEPCASTAGEVIIRMMPKLSEICASSNYEIVAYLTQLSPHTDLCFKGMNLLWKGADAVSFAV